jgi:regulator of protease activity HflC (stomatin/prohibitin superfamily)
MAQGGRPFLRRSAAEPLHGALGAKRISIARHAVIWRRRPTVVKFQRSASPGQEKGERRVAQPSARLRKARAMVEPFAQWVAFHPVEAALIAIILLLFLRSIRIANQYQRAVVFFLGSYSRTAGPGVYILLPLIEWQVMQDLRVVTHAMEQQEAITRDNVPIKINAVIWRRIVNPAKAVIEVRDVGDAVLQVAVTALRKEIGRHSLDDVLREQDAISAALQVSMDQATEPWGVKVERAEMKNIEIPPTMQRAMAQEAEALREKRARIIKAEAELSAAEKLRDAASVIMQVPAGLELRRMQMLTEVGAEQNTMTIVMMPSEFVELARSLTDAAKKQG